MFTPKYFYSRYYSAAYWAESGNLDNSRYVQMASLSVARPLDSPPERVNYVMVQAEAQNVRYRDDGIAPTATIGMVLYSNAAPTKFAGAIQLLKFIEVTASAKLNVRYY